MVRVVRVVRGWSGVGIRGVDVDGGVDMYEV